MTTFIAVLESGPILVDGPLELTDENGERRTVEGPKVVLCRCGCSEDKPFCDGQHTACGFKAGRCELRGGD